MNSHALKVLEYGRIVQQLHDLCFSSPAKRIKIEPLTETATIENNLDCLAEMLELYQADGGPPSLAFDDVDRIAEKAASSGDVLEPAELLKIGEFLSVTKGFVQLDRKFVNLNRLTGRLHYNEELDTAIRKSIKPPDEIRDGATPELRRIRREIAQSRERIEARFAEYLNSNLSSHLSDSVYTIRDGRYVLPVRESSRSKIKGIIHDRSSTGATYFIEPIEAIEQNNQLRELMSAEKQEIYRILRRLTDEVCAYIEILKENVEILSSIDLLSARARFAIKLNCVRPILSRERIIEIKSGYHPILRWRERYNNGAATVPLDFSLGGDYKTIVITGPNTGGKTVALKTVGLLCLMAQSAMYVPAGEGSTFGVFRDIYADIGDEQSLEASLSTFSSHLQNILEALREADSDCLVLLDELGAGTDPDEGSALGQAIIENLTERGVCTVVTTHHGRLKALAVSLSGVANGSLEFDQENLQPTYKFRQGIPGMSYALQTARKLGLSDSITARAESLIDQSERNLSAVIAELSGKLKKIDEQLENAVRSRLAYESLAKIYADKIESLEKQKKDIKKDSVIKAEQAVRQARAEIDSLIAEAKASSKKLEALRDARRAADRKLDELQKKADSLEPKPQGNAPLGLPGEQVYLREMNATGEIVEKADRDGRVRVRIGKVTLVTDLAKLVLKADAAAQPAGGYRFDSETAPSLELDLRGLTFDEAQPVLDKYLDDVYLAGLESVTIIHGKGTGALKAKIHQHLKGHNRVKSFRLGNWDEGSYGVTIVEMIKS
mgnify:CR=1 FL=1